MNIDKLLLAISMASVVPTAVAVGSEIAVHPPDDYTFLGYTTTTLTSFPSIGMQTKLCRREFGDNARWATTKEVREAYEAGSEIPFVRAAVRPVWIVVGVDQMPVLFDTYAELPIGGTGCAAGLTETNKGIQLMDTGTFRAGPCYATTFDLHVACSAPR